MLGSLRRGPLSIGRALSRPSLSTARVSLSSSLRTPINSRLPPLQLRSAVAAFHNMPRRHQQAVAEVPDSAVAEADAAANAQAQETNGNGEGLVTRFADLSARGLVHENVVAAITQDMKLETMTEVQSKSINAALEGVDMVAQAKTGTGKTMAFLVPTIQRILLQDPSLAQRSRTRAKPSDIRALIISPTRELAEQIATECKRITGRTGLITQVAVGGTQKAGHLRKVQSEGCHILVGTPGRLNDIFSDPNSGIEAPKLDCLVMDEADRLLDAGFTREINQIRQNLPDVRERERQNLMFSATLPQEVVRLVRQTLRPGFQFVKCVNDNEAPTHERVPQKHVTVRSLENITPAFVELCQKEIVAAEKEGARPFKAIIFINTTADVSLTYETLQRYRKLNPNNFKQTGIIQIHSRLTQSARTKKAETFRNAKSAILLSSDVTARGMDFPDVTHVIQLGAPRAREDYIHRIGRTARAGKEGEAWLILPEIATRDTLKALKGLPLKSESTLSTANLDLTEEGSFPAEAAQILKDLHSAYRGVPGSFKADAYKSIFGVEISRNQNKQELVNQLRDLCVYGWGMPEQPSVTAKFAQKMGLSKVRGLRIGKDTFEDDEFATQLSDSSDDYMQRPGRSGITEGRGGARGGRDFGGRGGDRGGRGFGGRGGDRGGRENGDRGGFGGRGGDRNGRDSGDRGGYVGRGGDRNGRDGGERGGFGGRDFGGRGGDRGGFGGRGGDRGGRERGGRERY